MASSDLASLMTLGVLQSALGAGNTLNLFKTIVQKQIAERESLGSSAEVESDLKTLTDADLIASASKGYVPTAKGLRVARYLDKLNSGDLNQNKSF